MKLREIDFDLPYVRNEERIQWAMKNVGLDQHEAVMYDYQNNWKLKERDFSNKTRCVASMLERITKPFIAPARKITIECFREQTDKPSVQLCGDTYYVRIQFDVDAFYASDDYTKKIIVLDTIVFAVNELMNSFKCDLSSILESAKEVKRCNYVNEWIYQAESDKSGKKTAQILVSHGVEAVNLFALLICDGNVVDKKLFANTPPSEWNYSEHLGPIEWLSDNSIIIRQRNGKQMPVTFSLNNIAL